MDNKYVNVAIADLEERLIFPYKNKCNPSLGIIIKKTDSQDSITESRKQHIIELSEKYNFTTHFYYCKNYIEALGIINEIIFQNDNNLDGILILSSFDTETNKTATKTIYDSIPMSYDVNNISDKALGRIIGNVSAIHDMTVPNFTVGAIKLLERYFENDLTGKEILIVNPNIAGGKPLGELLFQKNNLVTYTTFDFMSKHDIKIIDYNILGLEDVTSTPIINYNKDTVYLIMNGKIANVPKDENVITFDMIEEVASVAMVCKLFRLAMDREM